MLQEFLSRSPLAVWPLLAFLLFLATFLAVIAGVVWGAYKKKNFDHVAALPLDREDKEPNRGEDR